jgi:hypothetical protein
MKNNISSLTFIFLLLAITSCHKNNDGTGDSCSGPATIPWTLNGRFAINDSSLYHMTYDTSDSTAGINLWAYFQDPCNRGYATANIHITGHISTIASRIHMGYCQGMPEEEISAPLEWAGHYYERYGSMKRYLKNCSVGAASEVWIRTEYTFPACGSRTADLQYLSYASEQLSYSITYSN